MKVSAGKGSGLKAVSNERGVIAALAMDQRNSLKKALGENTTRGQLEEFKTAVVELLTPHASAVLLDPEFGLNASRHRAAGAGLLLAYEKSGYDPARPGRIPELLPRWSAARLQAAGADCCKVLLYYSPSESPEINDEKHAFIERIGNECRGADIPFFLELVTYDPGGAEAGEPEYAKQKPEMVRRTIAEFTQDRYAIDVLKVEIPVNLRYVEGARSFTGPKVYSRKEALDHIHRAAAAATRPFIYLSGGVVVSEFVEGLKLAAEAQAGFSGVLCGRAIWGPAMAVYKSGGRQALQSWLRTEGVKNISSVNECLKPAHPWFEGHHLTAA